MNKSTLGITLDELLDLAAMWREYTTAMIESADATSICAISTLLAELHDVMTDTTGYTPMFLVGQAIVWENFHKENTND